MIRGEINASRSLARVSMLADLTFRALLVSVDDFGRGEADPLMLKAALFPRRPDVTPEMARAWVDELAAEGCVRLYSVDGVEYVQLVAWEKHRAKGKRAEKSKYPEPPKESPEIRGESRGKSVSRARAPDDARITTLDARGTTREREEHPSGVAAEPATAAEQTTLLPVVTTDRMTDRGSGGVSGEVVLIDHGDRTRTDPVAWARMFSKEPDGDLSVEFVAEVLPEIEGRADAEFPQISDPSDRAWNGAVRSWLWRYWRARGRVGRDRGDERREARARRLVETARDALRLSEERDRRKSRATA